MVCHKYRQEGKIKTKVLANLSHLPEEAIDDKNFEVKFNAEKYELDYQLCGKYVLNSNVAKDKMKKEEVRQAYKNLQNVEHAFRDLKSDNICIRPVYHRNEAQTIGHIQICFYALVIIKELEKHIYPLLHEKNKDRKTPLSFDDIIAELTKLQKYSQKSNGYAI